MYDKDSVEAFVAKELWTSAPKGQFEQLQFINPKYIIYDKYVHVSGYAKWIYVLPSNDENKNFAFPFRALGIQTLKITKRCIKNWHDLPTPSDGTHAAILEFCELPNLDDMPNYKTLIIDVNSDFKGSIVQLFNYGNGEGRSIDFRIVNADKSCALRIFKMKHGSFTIGRDYSLRDTTLMNDVFELQDMLIELGFEHLL